MTTTSCHPSTNSRPSSPTPREQQIFHWVKFEGKTQAWVAQALGIHQSTVSRTIDRYDQWVARGGPAAQSGLAEKERRRAQHWLTYERNEWLLASALRLAGEMEQSRDTSESTITHHASNPSREIDVKTRHSTIDRSALAVRYLNLAFRINMAQFNLIEHDPLPPPAADPPCAHQPELPDHALTDDDLTDHEPATVAFARAGEVPRPESYQTPAAPPDLTPSTHTDPPPSATPTSTAAETSVKNTPPAVCSPAAYSVASNPPETVHPQYPPSPSPSPRAPAAAPHQPTLPPSPGALHMTSCISHHNPAPAPLPIIEPSFALPTQGTSS